MTFLCRICYRFASFSLKGVLRHIGTVHSHETNFHVVCGILGCPRTYRNYFSYKKHMYRKHRTELSRFQQPEDSSISHGNDFISSEDADCGLNNFNEESEVEPDTSTTSKLHAALMILKMKQKFKLSEVALDGLLEDFTASLQIKMEEVKMLVNKDISCEVFKEVLSKATMSPSIQSPFRGLETKYLRHRYFCDSLHLQEPVERKLGSHTVNVLKGCHTVQKTVHDYVYEISFIKTLQGLLINEHVREEVRVNGVLVI